MVSCVCVKCLPLVLQAPLSFIRVLWSYFFIDTYLYMQGRDAPDRVRRDIALLRCLADARPGTYLYPGARPEQLDGTALTTLPSRAEQAFPHDPATGRDAPQNGIMDARGRYLAQARRAVPPRQAGREGEVAPGRGR